MTIIRALVVQRRKESTVELREARDPVTGYIKDADVLLKSKHLPGEVLTRVVPGLCRQSIEAACLAVYRQKRLAKGDDHQQIEKRIGDNHTLKQRLAMALFEDPERAGDVLTQVKKWGSWAGDVVQACNKGSHGEIIGDPETFVIDSKKLVNALRGGK